MIYITKDTYVQHLYQSIVKLKEMNKTEKIYEN